MDFSAKLLNKAIEDLNYQDIEDYFLVEKEESDIIEFKSYSATHGNFNKNIEGVIRGICALLNSEGGIVIWGAPEGTVLAGNSYKSFVGNLSPVVENKDKDWLINKVSDSISPLPVGIKVATLEKNGGYIYVFEVQQSDYKPHQFKNTYFARLDGQTKPAPHYLVEALFRKISFPNLEGYVAFNKIDHNGNQYLLSISIFIFNFSQLQNEHDVSYRLLTTSGYFYKSKNPDYVSMYTMNGAQLNHKGFISVLHYGAPDNNNGIIILEPMELLKHNNKLNLLLSFGGKKSPMKSSMYELDLSHIDWNKKDHPNYLIVEKTENELISKRQELVGTNREQILKDLLKR